MLDDITECNGEDVYRVGEGVRGSCATALHCDVLLATGRGRPKARMGHTCVSNVVWEGMQLLALPATMIWRPPCR